MPFVVWRAARPGDLPRALLWAGASLAVVLLAPVVAMASAWLPECNFHRWTGAACPSCGATRAVLALARGRIGAAFAWNPLVAAAVLLAALSALVFPALVLVTRRVPVLAREVPKAFWWLLAALVAANWVYLIVAGV